MYCVICCSVCVCVLSDMLDSCLPVDVGCIFVIPQWLPKEVLGLCGWLCIVGFLPCRREYRAKCMLGVRSYDRNMNWEVGPNGS